MVLVMDAITNQIFTMDQVEVHRVINEYNETLRKKGWISLAEVIHRLPVQIDIPEDYLEEHGLQRKVDDEEIEFGLCETLIDGQPITVIDWHKI